MGTEMMGTQSARGQVPTGAQESVPEGRMVEELRDQARAQAVGRTHQSPPEELRVADLQVGGTANVQDGRTKTQQLGPTLISGAVLNCGGPLSRAPAALASLKLGVGELGGFTGSGTRRLGPPVLFPEPGATPPAPAGAAALGSFLGSREGERARCSRDESGRGNGTWGGEHVGGGCST